MLKVLKISLFLPALTLMMWSCQPEEESLILDTDPVEQEVESFILDAEEGFLNTNARIAVEDYELCQEPLEYSLITWPNTVVGTIQISNTKDVLVVNYDLEEGQYLKKTSLLLILNKDKSSNHYYNRYKKYIYPVRHEEGTSEYTYEIPLSDIDAEDGLIIAASAHLQPEQNSYRRYRRGKFAIATQNSPNQWFFFKNWLIDYTYGVCEETEVCEVTGTSGFLVGDAPPNLKSYDFSDSQIGIEDWGWGKVLQLKDFQTSLISLALVLDPTGENLASINANIRNINGQTIIRVTMPDELVINKSQLYFSTEKPTSGIPCNYGYENVYVDEEGNGYGTNFDEYAFEHDGSAIWVIYHADVVDNTPAN